LFNNIQNIKAKEKEMRLQKLTQLRHQAMAFQQFQNISSQYDSYDIQYQNVWAHSSFLPSEQMTSILNPLNEIAQEIQQNYESFKALEKDINDYAKYIGKIMDLAQALRRDLEQFFYTKININDEISLLRRQHNKKISSLKKKKEDFIEFKSTTISETENLKKRIYDEHKSTLEQAEKKQKLSEDVQKERQQRREFLTKSYEEQQQKKSTNEITSIVEPSPFHFTNGVVQEFWETCSWETLNLKDQKIVEILKAIDTAVSMQHLRSLLTPGTKLERLSGNREDQLSLRINDQWRLCFYWITGQGPIDIDLVDYHS
jgi:proteic killer suppression protein